MKRLFGLALVGFLFLNVFSIPAVASGDVIKVMTRNQYLGADLTPLILAQNPTDFFLAANAALAQIEANDFRLRARRLAKEVALTRPHLIGLQEVYDFKLNGRNGEPPYVNHLTETLAALAEKGQHYVVAATVEHLDTDIPLDRNEDGFPDALMSVLDRDVILVREDLADNSIALGGNYLSGGLCGVQIPNPAYDPDIQLLNHKFLQSTPSEDGCNYTIVAKVDSPADDIIVERGFVGVDVTVRGKDYRFVNTHLEQSQPDPTDPNSAIIQSLQSVELVGTLLATTPADRTLILLGDFNSSPEDVPIGPIVPPYQVIGGAGFADIWDTNLLKLFDRDGFTCCQDDDLANTMSLLDERIDLIYVGGTSFRPLAFVTGRVPIFPLRRPPNWASDHGGVFGKLIFRRDAMD